MYEYPAFDFRYFEARKFEKLMLIKAFIPFIGHSLNITYILNVVNLNVIAA